ncbi:MAG: hypothetical protein ACKO4L_05380 [Nodosilinea sp.]
MRSKASDRASAQDQQVGTVLLQGLLAGGLASRDRRCCGAQPWQ